MIDKLNLLLFGLPLYQRLMAICIPMAGIAFAAFKLKHLKLSGAMAAWVGGCMILNCVRFEGFLLFCIFYVSCNIVGKVFKSKNEIEKKGSQRDWVQVLANSFMALLAARKFMFDRQTVSLVMFACSVCEACADTWAGEIGRLSKKDPVSIRTFKNVEKGTSGGVSALGFAATFVSCLMIAFFYGLFWGFDRKTFLIIVISGFMGCVIDSFLGATCQALYIDKDGNYTEKETDTLVRGVKWIDNDMVNFMANVFATVLGITLYKLCT